MWMMKTSFSKTLPFVIVLLSVILFCSCTKSSAVSVRSEVFYEYFDTICEISSYACDSEESFRKNAAEVSDLLGYWHRLLDIYHEYDGMNNLCTVNRNAGGQAVKVDPELVEFVQYAKRMSVLTNGEMDISLGAVLRLWHDARTAGVPYLPSYSDLEEAALHVGFDLVEIDEEACTMRLADPAASLDPGALGKGYAAEKAARMLIEKGVTSYALNLGGNVRCIGTKADGSSWTTGIKKPSDSSKLAVAVKISDCSCVTSGSYERYFEVEGIRYPHIIDKDTLRPATEFSSVSVICKDSALADALSTALFCMSYEQGLELLSSLDDVQVIWISDDGTIRYTRALESVLTIL